MSIKKAQKAQKDKDDGKNVKCHSFMLESDRALLVKSNDFPLSSDAITINCGRPYGAMNPLDWTAKKDWLDEVPPVCAIYPYLQRYVVDNCRDSVTNQLPTSKLEGMNRDEMEEFAKANWTRRQLRQNWLREVVLPLGSCIAYPRHSVDFSFDSAGVKSSDLSLSSSTLAAFITQLLAAHCQLSNRQNTITPPPPAPGGQPLSNDPNRYRSFEDFQKMLGYSIRCVDFEPSETTYEKDVFHGADHELPPKRQVTMSSHYGSTYINVCCGMHYYQLPVLDTEKRRTKSVYDIACALEAIHNDEKVRNESLDNLGVSEEVKKDLYEMYGLLARMSAIPHTAAEGVYSRLCEASEVNKRHLEILDAGLFTVVIDGGSSCPSERQNGAQWLHSVFSLYYNWSDSTSFTATLFGFCPLEKFLHFLKVSASISIPDGDNGRRETIALKPPSLIIEDETGAENARGSSQDFQSLTSKAPQFQCLELWLPLKYRTALKPLSPIAPAPVWTPSWFRPGVKTPFAVFCVSLILAVERCLNAKMLRDPGRTRRPAVVFACYHSECTTPSVVSLMTDEVEAYIQAVRSTSVLLSVTAANMAASRAVASIATRLQEAIDVPFSLSSYSRAAYNSFDTRPADVCLSAGLFTNAFLSGCGAFSVSSVKSDLCVPSQMLLCAAVRQDHPQKNGVSIGKALVDTVQLGMAEANEPLHSFFTETFQKEWKQLQDNPQL